jgi:hypothetical protein
MMQKTIRRVIWREYLVYAMIFTITGAIWLIKAGAVGLMYIFWYKMIGAFFIFLYLFYFRKKYLYLFYNQGYGKRHLIAWCLIADVVLSIGLYIPLLMGEGE